MATEKNDEKNQENIELFWKKVLGILETEVAPMAYNTWVLKITPENLKDKSLDLVVPMRYAVKQLEKYQSLIEDAVNKVGKRKIKLRYVVREDSVEESNDANKLGPLFKPETTEILTKELAIKSGLTPKFTFENFVMGTSNQLAYAIAQAVAEKPGESYNPFFLYSGVGLGKTHLTQAIGNRILENNPKLNVVYTTGEAFMNELIETIQSGRGRGKYAADSFRNKFRKADVLLIDDIQFIIGRETTEMEFFHTFNTLYMAGKQIILTSDRPPKEFVKLEKRITSRFSSGIIADIQPPDLDLRIAILRNKRDQNRDEVSNSIIDFIAEKVTTNIRELEGAYLQILTKAKAEGKELTVELAEEVLGKNLAVKKSKPVNSNQIIKAVCKYYSVKSTDLKGKRRTKDIVIPRQVAMYLLREMTYTPYMSIGELLGGRDHTTIMYGVEKIEGEILEAGKRRQEINNIKQSL